MKVSKNCIDLIKQSEGFKSKPYLCPAGVATIGFGSTFYVDGTAVKMGDKAITEAEAVTLMIKTLEGYESAVNRYVKVTLNQNQFDALVDFAYNAGIGALQSSTLLKKVNGCDLVGASMEFQKWCHGGGKILQGLVTRRENERKLFIKEQV